MWNALKPEEMRHWEDLADQLAIQHALDHPEYKYQPRKTAEIRRRGTKSNSPGENSSGPSTNNNSDGNEAGRAAKIDDDLLDTNHIAGSQDVLGFGDAGLGEATFVFRGTPEGANAFSVGNDAASPPLEFDFSISGLAEQPSVFPDELEMSNFAMESVGDGLQNEFHFDQNEFHFDNNEFNFDNNEFNFDIAGLGEQDFIFPVENTNDRQDEPDAGIAGSAEQPSVSPGTPEITANPPNEGDVNNDAAGTDQENSNPPDFWSMGSDEVLKALGRRYQEMDNFVHPF